jgi:hypothetical protein
MLLVRMPASLKFTQTRTKIRCFKNGDTSYGTPNEAL